MSFRGHSEVHPQPWHTRGLCAGTSCALAASDCAYNSLQSRGAGARSCFQTGQRQTVVFQGHCCYFQRMRLQPRWWVSGAVSKIYACQRFLLVFLFFLFFAPKLWGSTYTPTQPIIRFIRYIQTLWEYAMASWRSPYCCTLSVEKSYVLSRYSLSPANQCESCK